MSRYIVPEWRRALDCGSSNWPVGATHTGFIEGAIFAALASNSLTFGLAGSAAVISGLTSLATTALSIGLSLALNAAFAQKPPSPKASDIQTNIRQALSARRRHYHRCKVGSVVTFGFRRRDKTYIWHYIGEGPIDGYEAFFLDRKPVTLDANGYVIEDQWDGKVRILTSLGTMTDGPFADIIAAFPELDRPTKPFRARGCAMVLTIFEEVDIEDMPEVYPNNMPAFECLIRGLKPVDPRTGLGTFTANAAACLLAEIAEVYKLAPTDSDRINVPSFAAFADHCDEGVVLKAGGNEPRYRCAGTVLCDAENEKRVQAIASICNADVYIDPQGRVAVRKKVSATPSIALAAADGDHLSISLESGRTEQRKFNAVKVVYREEQLNWKENEAYYRNAAAKDQDGRELVEPLDAMLCPSGTQAQRLGKLYYHQRNPDLLGKLTSGLQALELIADPVFSLDLSPEDDLQFTARSGNLEFDAASQTVSFDLQSVAADAESWNAATEEQPVIEKGPTLVTYIGEIPLAVTAAVDIRQNSAPVLAFSWKPANLSAYPTLPATYSQELQVVLDGQEGNEKAWKRASVNQKADTGEYAPLADGAAYRWRIRNIRAGKKFDWQPGGPVAVKIDPVAPQALGSFMAASGLGRATLTFATASDDHLATIAIYRVPAGVALNKAVHTKIVVGAAPGTTFPYADGDATRTNLLSNPGFDSDTVWTKGTGWTIAGGKATHGTGTASTIDQPVSVTAGQQLRYGYVTSGRTAGTMQANLTGGTPVNGAPSTGNGFVAGTLTAVTGNNRFGVNAGATTDGSIDDIALFVATAACAPQGAWDYYAFPLNRSGVEGPQASAVGILIY